MDTERPLPARFVAHPPPDRCPLCQGAVDWRYEWGAGVLRCANCGREWRRLGNPSGTARFGAVIAGAGLVAVAGLGLGLGTLIAFGGAGGVVVVGLPMAVRGWSRRLRYQAVIDLPEARAVRRPRPPRERGEEPESE